MQKNVLLNSFHLHLIIILHKTHQLSNANHGIKYTLVHCQHILGNQGQSVGMRKSQNPGKNFAGKKILSVTFFPLF